MFERQKSEGPYPFFLIIYIFFPESSIFHRLYKIPNIYIILGRMQNENLLIRDIQNRIFDKSPLFNNRIMRKQYQQ